MENYIVKLYKKFLYGIINKDEFRDMRHEINNANFSQLTKLIEEEWNEDMPTEVFAEKDKEEIRSNLDFYIECEKKRLFRKRIMYIAAVVIPFVFILSAFFINSQPTKRAKRFCGNGKTRQPSNCYFARSI